MVVTHLNRQFIILDRHIFIDRLIRSFDPDGYSCYSPDPFLGPDTIYHYTSLILAYFSNNKPINGNKALYTYIEHVYILFNLGIYFINFRFL